MISAVNLPTISAALQDSFRGARVLVTGGAGFIASHLIDALLAAGASVVPVDLRPAVAHPARSSWPEVRQETVGSASFQRFYKHEGPFDYLFHLAGQAYAARSVQEPIIDFTDNLAATLNLLEYLRTLGWGGRLVFASSAAVYGDPQKQPIEEHDPTVPISPYGVSKLAAERYVSVYARLYGIQAASLRLFSVYGPRQTKQVVYDFFVKLHRSPKELLIIGDGSQMRDLVYVADVVHAFLLIAAQGCLDGSAYNVASGSSTSTADLARLIVALQQPDAALRFTGQTRPGDPERWLGSNVRLSTLGWAPSTTLREGLSATAAWFNYSPPQIAKEA